MGRLSRLLSSWLARVLDRLGSSDAESVPDSQLAPVQTGHSLTVTGLPQLAFPVNVNASIRAFRIEIDNGLLHMSDVLIQVDDKVSSIKSNPLVSRVVASSTKSNEQRFSVESWLGGNAPFFSTRRDEKSFLLVELQQEQQVEAIFMVNRPQHRLWARLDRFRLYAASDGQNFTLLFNNGVWQNYLDWVTSFDFSVEDCKSPELLVCIDEFISRVKAVSSRSSDRLVAELEHAVREFAGRSVEVVQTDLDYFCDNPESLRNLAVFFESGGHDRSEHNTLFIIYYLLAADYLKDAYSVYKRDCISWPREELEKVKFLGRSIGLAKKGYPLVPATHKFARPIRDWNKAVVFESIYQMLSVVSSVQGVTPMICYGTLLGLYRDGDFIEHDDDIDLLCVVTASADNWYSEIDTVFEHLRRSGYRVRKSITNDTSRIPFLQAFSSKHGIHTDLFFAVDAGTLTSLPMKSVKYREIASDLLMPPTTFTHLGYELPAPRDIEGFLLERYGSNWRVPDEFFRAREATKN